jgi:hypothetical protein
VVSRLPWQCQLSPSDTAELRESPQFRREQPDPVPGSAEPDVCITGQTPCRQYRMVTLKHDVARARGHAGINEKTATGETHQAGSRCDKRGAVRGWIIDTGQKDC